MGDHTTHAATTDVREVGYDADRYESDPDYRAMVDEAERLVREWRQGYGSTAA